MTAETSTFIPCLDCPWDAFCIADEQCGMDKEAQRFAKKPEAPKKPVTNPEQNPFRPTVNEEL